MQQSIPGCYRWYGNPTLYWSELQEMNLALTGNYGFNSRDRESHAVYRLV